MELRHLRYFIAVAEEGHITRAAERLRMQQPPLSQQIKAIERELDVQLFRRKPRGVELTDAGRAFLQDALATLARLDRGIDTTRRTARGEQGRICLGVTQTSPFHPFVPRVIRAFREAYPLVSVTLEEGNSDELVEHLRNERIDAAFIRMPPADAHGLVISALLEEELVVALSEGHVLAQSDGRGNAALPFKALAGETFIAWGRPQGMGAYPTVIAACHAAGFNPRLAHEALRLASTLNLVAIGLGISIVPASMQSVQMDGLAYRRLKSSTPLTVPLMLASRRGDPSAVVRRYLDLVKRAAKDFSVDNPEREARRVRKRKVIRSYRAGSAAQSR
jgi:DNA-binding transcriptional LysR family regulator